MATRRDVIIGGAAALLSAGRARAAAEGRAFGGTWRLVGPGAEDPALRACVGEVVARIDAAMSPWRPDTALSRFNRAETSDWQPMPPELCRVAAEALAVADRSGGAFDPTVGPAVRRFGFGPIEGVSGRRGAVEVRADALRKTDPGATLDLCGIAKGHALDAVAAALRARGMADGLLEIGGELRAWGAHPGGRAWRAAIELPGRPGAGAIVAPRGRALATSGHHPNGLRGPVTTSHIIDPHTGHPATGWIASVSVLASSGAQADAWATALLARGAGGPALARRAGIAALFLLDMAGAPDRILTGDFADFLLA